MGRYFNGSLLSSVFQVSFTSSYSWFPKSFYRNNKHHFIYCDDSTGVFNIYYGYFDSLVHTPSNITNSDENCLNYDFMFIRMKIFQLYIQKIEMGTRTFTIKEGYRMFGRMKF